MNDTIKLGVNIDHVATIRNARGDTHPDPVKAAILAKQAGADLITAHLREDRRHIQEEDLLRLINEVGLPLNLEMAATEEMVHIASKLKPMRICIVPENREELTTEGGLDIVNKYSEIKNHINCLISSGIKVSLFIDPETDQIQAAKNVGVNIIELHTGSYANSENKFILSELNRLKHASQFASKLGLEVHAGHGLSYRNIEKNIGIPEIKEVNIGHFLIGESIYIGIEKAVRKMRQLIDSAKRNI